MTRRARVRRRAIVAAVLLLGPLLALVVAAALTPLPAELRAGRAAGSVRVDDRDGELLREVRADDGARARWIPFREIGAETVQAILAAEDRRFYRHAGVDPVAIARAALHALVQRRIVSGASTLTMQLARTLRPHPRTLRGKLGEMALAVRLEWALPKDRILEEYANRVSFGPNLRGVAAASHAFFGKSPASLSAAEAALVAGLARGPSLYDVERRPALVQARRDRVLGRMQKAGWLTADAAARARGQALGTRAAHASFGAPHLVASLLRGDLVGAQPGLGAALQSGPAVARVRTTIDSAIQRTAETQVAVAVRQLVGKGVTAASAIVLDNGTGDVLAYVGSPDFFDDVHGGQNDGVRALRQPGSTLKPFLYELAMERLGYDPATALPDVDLHLNLGALHDYAPHDYDGHVRGPVRLREALGSSLNIPAVWTAHALGAAPLLDRLHALGFASLHEEPEFYGPALALGDGEVTLLVLANAYATLAREGVYRPLRFVSQVTNVAGGVTELPPGEERRVLPRPLADLTIDILKDHDAREAAFGERTVLDFPFAVAAKTGTSKGFRDNWTVGFTSRLTVAVWVGNFSGEPMNNVSGITGAGPLFHAVLEAATAHFGGGRDPGLPVDASDPEGLERVTVCALSGEPAGPDCPHRIAEWRPVAAPAADRATCTMHERVRIDRRNGLRAGPGCDGSDVEERVFERFPEDLAAWAVAAGRAVAPTAWSPSCPGTDPRPPEAGVRIAYPLSGARFVVDPDAPRSRQRLDVQIVAPAATREAALRVDGHEVARVAAPFAVSWPLVGGVHELVAVADGVESARVQVTVRDDAVP